MNIKIDKREVTSKVVITISNNDDLDGLKRLCGQVLTRGLMYGFDSGTIRLAQSINNYINDITFD